jgi:UDP-N-acetylmuramate dehydrogenase
VGGAAVSEKHANFFQADPGATARDVYELVARIREIVEARTGVRLEPELCFVGFRTCRRT